MKKTFVSFAAFFLALGLSSFLLQTNAQETRDLKPFTGIGISISADIYFTQGNTHEITVEGNPRDVEDLITEVKDGFLKLRYDSQKVKRSKLTIHVTAAELEKISLAGSAKFNAEPFSSKEMEIAISGSGVVTLASLDGDEMEVKISGSGQAVIENGTADEMEVKISGSGKLLADQFQVSECEVYISGSGNCKVHVTDELEAKLSGSGSLFYRGNPEVNSTVSGSGKVRSL